MKLNKIIGVGTLVAVLALTGCGKSNKLVCTQEDDMGKVEMTVSFKGDKVNEVEMATTFEDEETAKLVQSFYAAAGDEVPEAKLDGKKLTIKYSGKTLEEELGDDVNTSKDELKKQLEEEGYKCK